MGHLVCRAQVTCVLHDGPKTHVAQQPNGYGSLSCLPSQERKQKSGFLLYYLRRTICIFLQNQQWIRVCLHSLI